jgi:hypothetical protein
MRKGICFLLMAGLAASAFAGDEDEQTLLSGQITHGGFGGPVVKFTRVKGEFGVLVGGRGGWIINHTLSIGGGGYGLVNPISTDPKKIPVLLPFTEPMLSMGYGGFELEYVNHSGKVAHSTLTLLVGAGGVGYQERNNTDWDWDDDHRHPAWDSFFIAEPGLNVELNMTRFFRIDAGASYRFVSGVEKYGLVTSDVAGPSINLTFKFGKF